VSACVCLHAFAINYEDGQFYSQDQFYKDGQAHMKEQKNKEQQWHHHKQRNNAQEEDRREEAQELELLEGKIKRKELKEQLFEYLNIMEE
jgi:uridine phosphorylase